MATYNWSELFEIVTDAVPDREAVVCGERRLTYRELDERATRAAHWLAARGVGRGDWIGLYLKNGSEYLEAWLGAYKLGAVAVNVNYRYVEDELRYLFDDAGLVAVVFDREYAERVARVVPDCPRLRVFGYVEDGSGADVSGLADADSYEEAIAAQSTERDFAERSGDDLYVLYTGGTTGMPKGVMWRQEDAFFACIRGGDASGTNPVSSPEELGERAAAAGPLALCTAAPLMHGAAQWTSFICFSGGGKLVLVPGHFDAERLCATIGAEQVNSLGIVGDAMGRPFAHAAAASTADLSSLFIVANGGAILSQAVQDEITAALPNVMILDAYGVSETGYQGSGAGQGDGGPQFVVDATTQVLDPDTLETIPPGSDAVGWLARSGRIPLGYHNDEEKTAKTFVTDPHGVRWAVPGDMAKVTADGSIVLLGRGNQCINTGGEKVYPEEVEAVLKAHPSVYDAVVVGIPDERWGSRVAAVVSTGGGDDDPTLDALASHCRDHLAGYKVPRDLVVVDEVVRSPSGKPDYRWARSAAEKAAAGA